MARPKSLKLDRLDERLLQTLERNPRSTNRQLASLMGVTEVTVASRIRRMSERGIARVVASHEWQSEENVLGFVMFIKVAPDAADAVAKELTAMEDCRSVSTVSGAADIVATFTVDTTTELRKLLEGRIAEIPGIKAVDANLFLDMIGYRDCWAKLVS